MSDPAGILGLSLLRAALLLGCFWAAYAALGSHPRARVVLCRIISEPDSPTGELMKVETIGGQTTQAAFGGKGVRVTGKVEKPSDPKNDLIVSLSLTTHSNYQQPVVPAGTSQGHFWKMMNDYHASDEFKKSQLASREYGFGMQPDGSFQVENVPPGVYDLEINFFQKSAMPNMPGEFVKELRATITVPSDVDRYEVPASALTSS